MHPLIGISSQQTTASVVCIYACVYAHSDKDGLISKSVTPLRQVLDGDFVRTVAGWVIHAVILQHTHAHARFHSVLKSYVLFPYTEHHIYCWNYIRHDRHLQLDATDFFTH